MAKYTNLPKKQSNDKQSNDRPTGVGREIMILLGIAVYVLGFYLLEPLLRPLAIKQRALLWLLLPDQLASQWVGGHLSRFGLLDRTPVLLGTTAILGVAFLAGRLVLDLVRADRWLSRLEVALTSIGVGLNLLSLFTLSAGLAGMLHQRLLFLVVGLSICVVSLLVAALALQWGAVRPFERRSSVA